MRPATRIPQLYPMEGVFMPDPARLIKKYPNRRLYDTRTSTYITLNDVKDLVLSFVEFTVIDAKTGEDLTRSILLQIISEEEAAGAPLLTSELLARMIRFYGQATQGMLGKFLETNLKSFAEFQQQLQAQSSALFGENNTQAQADMWAQFMNFQGPAMQTIMSTYMDQSRKMVHEMQDQLKHQTINLFSGSPLPASAEQPPPESGQ